MIDRSQVEEIREAILNAAEAESIDDVRRILQPYYDVLVKHYEDDLLEIEQVYDSGKETYGYGDIGEIQGTLDYLANRWNSCARVRWLIDLINPEYVIWLGSF